MKATLRKSKAGTAETSVRLRESRKEAPKEETEASPSDPAPVEDDIESEMPIRGRPSKKLLLQKQQQRRQSSAKVQQEVKAEAAADTGTESSAASGSGRPKVKRTTPLYKKTPNTGAKSHNESYVMRLFERSLDLSKYKEKTPLYPICRAWMANQPRNPSVAMYDTDETEPPVKREDDAEEVLAKLLSGEMKVLTQMPMARKTELPVIPPRLPHTEDKSLEGASKEELLAANVKHWKTVRGHWLKHAKKYDQERYEIIDKIMNVLCKCEASSSV